MLLQLGNYIFEGLKVPLSLGETTAARFAKVPLLSGKDIIQHTGSELTEAELEVRLDVSFCEPQTEIDALKATQAAGDTLPLLTGNGGNLGNFVIVGIDITHETCNKNGRTESATLAIKLLESPYATPVTESAATAKKKGLQSNYTRYGKSGGITLPKPRKPSLSAIKSVAADINKAKTRVAQVKAAYKKFKTGTATFKRTVRDVRKCANDVKMLYTTAKTKAAVVQKIVRRATHLPTSLDGAIGYAENLAVIDDVADTAVIERNINALKNSADKVSADAAPVVAMAAAKEQD
jgi:phage protein U